MRKQIKYFLCKKTINDDMPQIMKEYSEYYNACFGLETVAYNYIDAKAGSKCRYNIYSDKSKNREYGYFVEKGQNKTIIKNKILLRGIFYNTTHISQEVEYFIVTNTEYIDDMADIIFYEDDQVTRNKYKLVMLELLEKNTI
jgi:hypothetical protein